MGPSGKPAQALNREADLWVGAMHAHLAQAHAHLDELERTLRARDEALRLADAAMDRACDARRSLLCSPPFGEGDGRPRTTE